jgi:hypothetical protein
MADEIFTMKNRRLSVAIISFHRYNQIQRERGGAGSAGTTRFFVALPLIRVSILAFNHGRLKPNLNAMHFDTAFINRLLVGNIEYILLVISMMMTRMVWLRSLAIASGVAGFIYSAWWLHDPVGVFWETVFTLVNVVQLALIKYRNFAARFSADDRDFYDRIFPQLEPHQMHRLLKTGRWLTGPTGTKLTQQGEVVPHLCYLFSGTLEVLVHDTPVGACDPKSLIGEISIASGQPATATVVARDEIHYLALEREALHKLMKADADIAHAVERSLRRNLETTLIQRTKPPTSGV